MNWLQSIILGIVQGIAEFLPISSSGHLVIVPWLFNWAPAPLVFDSTVHLGTLVAIIMVFWQDCIALLGAWIKSLRTRRVDTPEARMAWLIIIATIPAATIGFLMEDFFEGLFSQPAWVGVFLLITGTILALSERLGERDLELDDVTWMTAVLIGFAQAGAIAPGISRSGATIAAGLARGMKRDVATRFSFLLAIPIMLGAGLFKLLDFAGNPLQISIGLLLLGFGAAAISGYIAIRFLLSYVRSQTLYPFAIYCWIAGVLTVALAAFR